MKYIVELPEERVEEIRAALSVADQLLGDGTGDAPLYKLRGALHNMIPLPENVDQADVG